MLCRSTLAAAALMALASVARAGDWSIEKHVEGVALHGTGDLLLSGDDVVVTGFGRAWLLDGATGETLATCVDDFPSQSQEARYLVTTDLLLTLRGEDHMLFGLRTGAPMSAPASASFAVSHDALFSLSGDERPCLARIEPVGRTGWTQDVEPGLELDAITASKHGVVLSGRGGFVEFDPTGKVVRSWRVPEEERLRVEACRTQVVDDLVVVSLLFAGGEATLRVFKGRRPRELSLRGQAAPGVVTLDGARGEPFVIRRGSTRAWVLIELTNDASGPGRHVAVDLARASAGPEVVAQRSSIARTGRAIHAGQVVDLVTGETSPGPDGEGLSVAHAFWYRYQDATLRYGELDGGEANTLSLPPLATVSTTDAAPLHDVLIYSAPASVGTVDLRRGRVDVVQTHGPSDDVRVSRVVATGKAAFFLLWSRGERGAPSLRVVRRAR